MDITKMAYVHGGPGGNSGLFFGHYWSGPWSHRFPVSLITYDQLGCGKNRFYEKCEGITLDWDVLADDFAWKVNLSARNDRFGLVGESFGTTLAIEFAKRFPEYISTLILVGPVLDFRMAKRRVLGDARAANRALLARFDRLISCGGPIALKEAWADLRFSQFFMSKKKRIGYRSASSKAFRLVKDLPTLIDTSGYSDVFELSFLEFLSKGEVVDLRVFQVLSEALRRDDQRMSSQEISTEVDVEELKKAAKRYGLFFYSPETVEVLTRARSTAIAASNGYLPDEFDFTHSQYMKDFSTSTDWLSRNRLDDLVELSRRGVKIWFLAGRDDPFYALSGDDYIRLRDSEVKLVEWDNCGHSPIYEYPSKFFDEFLMREVFRVA